MSSSESKAIPIKRESIGKYSELPSDYSSTPGGTMFSTTPGGSKLVYDKAFMLSLRNSPCSKTPPSYDIPEKIIPRGYRNKNGLKTSTSNYNYSVSNRYDKNQYKGNDEDQFQLEL